MKNLSIILLSLLIGFQFVSAQNNSGASNLNREAVLKEISKEKQLGLVLTIDKVENNATIQMNEIEKMFDENTTAEEKIKLKYFMKSIENLREARSFLEIISFTTGNVNIVSHEIVSDEKQETHYFIFTL